MRSIRVLIIGSLFLFTIYRLFFGLGNKPIERWDEETNIKVVSDSITQSTLPVLYLGQIPFFEKPPLWYYLNIGIGKTFGITNTSMRMTSAISGLLIILTTAYLAWKWWGYKAMSATWIVLLSSEQLYTTNVSGYFATHTFRSADLDALQIFFILLAFVSAIKMNGGLIVPTVLGVATAMAVLTKGPMGLLPILFVSILLPIKPKTNWRSLIISWAVFLMLVLPWYIFMTINFGSDFLATNMGYHLAERAMSPLEGHEATIGFYGEILSNWNIFPAGFLALISLFWIAIGKKYKNKKLLFLTLMTISSFIIPSIVQTKLSWYILPFYPFSALLIGAFLTDLSDDCCRIC